MIEKDPKDHGGNTDVVKVAGKKPVERVVEKNTKDAAPDCGGHAHYGRAVVSVEGVCEGGSNPQERRIKKRSTKMTL